MQTALVYTKIYTLHYKSIICVHNLCFISLVEQILGICVNLHSDVMVSSHIRHQCAMIEFDKTIMNCPVCDTVHF